MLPKRVRADAYQRGWYASNVFGTRPFSRAPLNARVELTIIRLLVLLFAQTSYALIRGLA
jgi:hypothetical protein